MKKLNFLSLSFLAVSAFFLQTCKKDHCVNKDRTPLDIFHKLSEEDKSKVPFKGNDTLVYYSDAGDTAILYGQEKKEGYNWAMGGDGDFDCPRTYNHYYESNEYSYIGNDSGLFQIKYNLFIYEFDSGSGIHYVLNTFEYGFAPSFINSPSNYKDSILIKGNYFKGSKFIYLNSVTFLYNYKYGFLQIKFEPGKNWTLKIP